MPSPFPGMNPYLEQEGVWRDFRLCFTVAVSQMLNRALSPRYYSMIRVNEFFYESPERIGYEPPQPSAVVNASAAGCLPVRLPTTDKDRESYLEICDAKSQEVVTVVQLLSRSTKFADPPSYREQYLAHRTQTLWRPVHFVEIDLLRGGERLPANQAPGADYCALVSRWQQRPWVEAWSMRLRERLPTLPIPLADDIPDVPLDLQAVLQQVWAGARYDLYIYDGEPDPPLSPQDAEWARQLRGRPSVEIRRQESLSAGMSSPPSCRNRCLAHPRPSSRRVHPVSDGRIAHHCRRVDLVLLAAAEPRRGATRPGLRASVWGPWRFRRTAVVRPAVSRPD